MQTSRSASTHVGRLWKLMRQARSVLGHRITDLFKDITIVCLESLLALAVLMGNNHTRSWHHRARVLPGVDRKQSSAESFLEHLDTAGALRKIGVCPEWRGGCSFWRDTRKDSSGWPWRLEATRQDRSFQKKGRQSEQRRCWHGSEAGSKTRACGSSKRSQS